MSKPKEFPVQTASDEIGEMFARLSNLTPMERRKYIDQINEQGKHLREMEAIRVKSAMRDQSLLNIVLITVLCVTLAICFALLFISDDQLKTQGSFTVMAAILSGCFSYLAGKRAD